MTSINEFLAELQTFKGDNVFNPWKEWTPGIDIGSTAPIIRCAHLEQYLRLREKKVKWILIAEALGYQGGRFSGIALTSERILLGHQKDINPTNILSSFRAKRTSNPVNPTFKNIQKELGFAEPTATIVWQEIENCNIDPFQTLFWNIFPFHPYDEIKGLLSNRTPNKNELQLGIRYVNKIMRLYPSAKIITIGKHSKRILNQQHIHNMSIPHPANGGINNFKNAMREMFINKVY